MFSHLFQYPVALGPRLTACFPALQDRGEATDQARAERDRILKEMRENLSNRTYVKNIVSDLVSTIE